MWRTAASILAGLISWAVIVTLLNFGLRAAITGYHDAEPTLQFTMAMKVGRLTEAALASLAAGAVVGLIDRRHRWVPVLVGAIILAMFLPVHVKLWDKFQVWYHLAFLVPLVPLVVAGSALVQRTATARRATVS